MTVDRPDPVPSVDELRREQRAEMSGMGLGTRGQTRGAAMGLMVGALAGGLALLVIALIAFRDGPGLVVLPVIGAAFGAVAGMVYEGSRNPEREGEVRTATGEPDTSAAVAGNPPEANEH